MSSDTTPAAVEALKLAEEAKNAARDHAGAIFADSGVDRCRETWDAAVAAIDRLAALASLPPVTQAKSEAVAEVNNIGMLKATPHGTRTLKAGDKLYAAPREAVERQPLTESALNQELCLNGLHWDRPNEAADWFREGARFAEREHGIGPATQEKQHG